MACRFLHAALLRDRLAGAAAVVLLAACAYLQPPAAGAPAGAEAKPADAVPAVLALFDRYPVVALGEAHGLEEEREFIDKLVRDPAFADKVNDVVVEFGNAKYQGVIDRYLAGDDVPEAELQQVWREHTCPGPQVSSAYPKYFAAFREVNKALPPARRFRVLLGDPPIDWGKVRDLRDFGPFLAQRDAHFAGVVEEQVLAKGRKCLLILGGGHLMRKEPLSLPGFGPKAFTKVPAPGDKQDTKEGKFFGPVTVPGGPTAGPAGGFANVAQRIEKRHPGKLFIVLPHDGLGEGSAEVEKRFGKWPAPSLVGLKGTWLGAVAASQLTVGPKSVKMFRDGKPVGLPKPDPAAGPRLQEVADALLYLGPRETLTLAPDADYSRDKAFLAELKRRRELTGLLLPSTDEARRKPLRRYIDQ
jgi:hypothetical protein